MNSESRNRFFRSKREAVEHNGRSHEMESENDSPEGDGKMKTKLMSMWYNMKYGWTKTNFSKDSPVWMLGICYHRKLMECDDSRTGNGVKYKGIEDFKRDFCSRIWLTYRKEFPILNGSSFTTDCGWGCMLRSGQMLLAQGLICHFLGRGWQWSEQPPCNEILWHQEQNHRNIIKWFGDNPSCNSPFSIHMLVMLGEATGKKAGDWYGPGSVSHLLRKAMDLASKENQLLEQLCVYVAQDCAVYNQDVIDLCQVPQLNPRVEPRTSKSLILLVPLRLGAEKLNAAYAPQLTYFLTLETCIGIIGGRPKHSLYFVGFQDDKLIHLDPHYCQEVVDVWQPHFPLWSFHCKSPRKMNLMKLDPSCCIGFYFRSLEEYESFRDKHNDTDDRWHHPLFVFCDGRGQDALTINPFSIAEDSIRYSEYNYHETDDELESEEFEIL